MSINDEVKVVYYERRNSYIIKRGNETFYDDNRVLYEWDTQEEAEQWAQDNLMCVIVWVDQTPIVTDPQIRMEL